MNIKYKFIGQMFVSQESNKWLVKMSGTMFQSSSDDIEQAISLVKEQAKNAGKTEGLFVIHELVKVG